MGYYDGKMSMDHEQVGIWREEILVYFIAQSKP
jgi:hypothetical protein